MTKHFQLLIGSVWSVKSSQIIIFRLFHKHIFQPIFLFHIHHITKSAKVIILNNTLFKQTFGETPNLTS